ncbi:MAG: hypothetical protein ACM3JD_14720, partial [Rudaea sp.]
MAALGIKQDEPNRLVLETPAAQTLSSLFELVVVLGVAYSFLSPFFDNPTVNPLQLLGQDPLVVIGLLIGLFIVVRILSSMLSGTRVV